MTADEAKDVLRIAVEGAAKQDLDDDRLKFMAIHLGPLPFERTRRRVHEYVLTHKWLSSLEELLDAAGVSTAARADLAHGIHEGGELLPSLRSMSGWEYVPTIGPLPLGVAEAMLAAGQTLPHNRACAELPAGPTEVGEDAADAGVSIRAAIGTGLQERKNGALRRAFETMQHPPTPLVADRDAMPPILREAVEAAELAQDRATKAEQRCQAQERAYRELCDDLADRIRDGAPDSETARAVVVELLQRLLADPGYGLSACVDALRDALIPGAEVVVKAEYGANPDPFDDGVGALVALRVLLRRV